MNAIQELTETPVVLESYGGVGKLYAWCYIGIAQGVVFEKNPAKAEILARQRPTWATYEGDCVRLLAAGVGGHLCVNFFDVDAYGDPWPALQSWFESDRPRAKRLVVTVNDGIARSIRLNQGWQCKSLEGAVAKYGNAGLFDAYPQICRELLTEKAAIAGYKVKRWVFRRAGSGGLLSHYACVLEL